MDKNVGYDNTACCANADDDTRMPSMELERVVDCRPPAVAKCCGGPSDCGARDPSGEPNAAAPGTANACLPKCPAVKTSPWDPLKTRIALYLTAAIVVWLLIGVTAQNF